ncbi:hypothetical protein H8L32_16870 [Undibacterium sp. CY18W]|uniref:Uncharacterized protein n=1 Tax=Undibacterium hunanense TaxID=2762292 RepID=A0ABR6ZTD2_9BURK|nr:hypothetical protein [Undibacterium hunanense]MBC3919167.1 hypothetical protein [Undibacterium hunanense]
MSGEIEQGGPAEQPVQSHQDAGRSADSGSGNTVGGGGEAAAAAAAFDRARSETSVATKAELDKDVIAGQAEAQAAPRMLAGLTEQQIAGLLGEIPKYRKQIDHLAGNNGKLNAAIQRLQQEVPRGQAVTVNDEDLAEMREIFPELADLTKGALNKILGKLNTRGTGPGNGSEGDSANGKTKTASRTPDDYVALAKKAAMEVASSERVNTHVELLHGLNPGWDQIIGLPDADGRLPQTDYRRWLAAQPMAYQTRMHNSNNAFEIGASIKAYQQARDAFAKKSQQNKSRLANAMQPQGQVAARGVISEQSAADKAFQARRQR